MNCLFYAYSTAIFSRTSPFVLRSSISAAFSTRQWKGSFQCAAVKTINLDSSLTRFSVQRYSTRKASGSKSRSKKVDPVPVMKEEKDSFFVVRKGDVVGVYKSLSDCQAQVGSSICNTPASVYKGYSMTKDTEDYLLSRGLKNALYSIRAADLSKELFGTLVPCPLQQSTPSRGETSSKDLPRKRLQELLGPESGEPAGSTYLSNAPRKHAKLEIEALVSGRSCTIEFDGASKGNPGQAGAGVVLRGDDGSLICRLREGLGIATNNVAEYRAMILGLRYAFGKGFTRIRVVGDSKLVCMQLQGLWKCRHENIMRWYEEAKILRDKFHSFQITHVLRKFNSEADAQANLAVELAGEAFSALLN